MELKWEVSYSDRYGQARQLAYKLDTIVIDQRIEQVGKPVPERIRIGTLREVCHELDLTHGGKSKNLVKRALLQNAFNGITAKLKYNPETGRGFEASNKGGRSPG